MKKLKTVLWLVTIYFLCSSSLYSKKLSNMSSSEIDLVYVRPGIITPNGDGLYDFVKLQFNNPYDKIDITAKIFDIRGALVRNLSVDYTPGIAEIRWDGRDENANIVRSGIYIYQIESGKETKRGTIVVVR